MSGLLIGEMRVGDLVSFLAVLRSGSISNAARELGVTPSQVSKAIARLESAWHIRLLARSSRGVTLTEAGHRARPHIEEAIAHLSSPGDAMHMTRLTLAAPSSLIDAFLPSIAQALPSLYLRALVLPPQLLRADAGENVFDATLLTADQDRFPPSWVSSPLGDLRQGLFGSPRLSAKLGPQPVPVARLRAVPFVVPVYNVEGRYVAVEDDCPLPLRDRLAGHQAQTIGLALALAAVSDQLVFGPAIAAHEHLAAGRLVEIRVRDWDSRSLVYLACNGDRVLAQVQRSIVTALQDALATRDPLGGAAGIGG
jgi:DNA-binding transcriptional LysR family regulator